MAKFQVVVGGRRKSQTKRQVNEPEGDYKVEYDEGKKRAAANLAAVRKLTALLCRNFADEMVKAVRNQYKYCVLFRYNDDLSRGALENDTIDGISTKVILSGSWIPEALKYYPKEECKPIGRRIEEYITQKQFNGGVDHITKMPYHVSVFHYKKDNSVFPNGVIISRTGIAYK